MLFKSSGKFIDNVTDSFGRFGIKAENYLNGQSKDVTRFHMFDSIHDSSYVAVSRKSSAGKKAEKVWREIIDNDLVPVAKDPYNKGDTPAAAIIAPSKDMEVVENILRKKGFSPTVYQLFPGYVVAGLNKSDMARLIDGSKKNGQKEEKASSKKGTLLESGETASGSGKIPKGKRGENEFRDGNPPQNAPNSHKNRTPLSRKLAAAALLGVAVGFVPFAVNSVLDEMASNKEEKELLEKASKAAEKYFSDIKNGSPENEELLKAVASNPNLAKEYLEKLADTPVGIEAAKNPAAPEKIIRKAADSKNPHMRAAAASNPGAPPEILKKLSRDPSSQVRGALARNPSIKSDLMEKLSEDMPEVREKLLENENLSPEILDAIAKNSPRNCEFVKKMMANPCIPRETADYNASNPDECVRAGVAGNPNSSPEILEKLAEDSSPDVRKAAFKNPGLPAKKLNDLFPKGWKREPENAKLENDRKAALENSLLSPEIMEKALFMSPENYAGAIASNKRAPQNLTNKIADMAQGRPGLMNFVNSAMNMKTDEGFKDRIKREAAKKGEPVAAPLRRALNKSFVQSAYDPLKLIEDMRKFPGLQQFKEVGKVSERGGYAPEGGKTRGRNFVPAGTFEYFSQIPIPEAETGDNKIDPAAEKAALKTADDIVSRVMADVLPAVEGKGTAGKSGNNGSGASSGSGASPARFPAGTPGAAAQAGYGGEEYPGDISQWLFQNACEDIDALSAMMTAGL